MISRSIHPRNWIGGNGKVSNTCAPRKNAKYYNRALRKLEIRRQSYDSTIKSLPGSVNPASFRRPGSMKLRT